MEPNKLENAKRWVDLIASVAVILTMVFIAFQSYEMHTGSIDTHDLAVAAKAQADADKTMVDEMKKSETDTHDLAIAASKQADASQGPS
jgi:hypothetical protein